MSANFELSKLCRERGRTDSEKREQKGAAGISLIGKCTGLVYPHGSRVRVLMGTDRGSDCHTRDLQNESENMFFGPKMGEIQLIS